MARDSAPLPDDPIYRAVLIVLMGSVVIGAIAAITGELVFRIPALSQAGGWITVVCGAIYFVFRWLGRREAKRRAAEAQRSREGWDDFDERSE